MDLNKDVMSVMPIEETIIDPLYEPLKLNRYKLCPHLQRLKDGSHKMHGVSPYLLFDVEWMNKVVEVLKGAVKDEELYLFSWDNVPGSDNEKLIKFLKDDFDIDLAEDSEIGKPKDRTISISKAKISVDIVIANDEKKATLTIRDGKTYDLNVNVKKEDGKLNIYKELSEKFNECYTKFDKALKEYLEVNETMRVNDGVSGVSLEGLINKRKAVVDNYKGTKDKYRKILLKTLYKVSPFDKFLFEKISHLLQLAHPIRVSCPICRNDQFMCEEGKIYSLKEALLRTFELRRAKWLHMSGSLHTIHRAATHTRLSHQIGSMIVGVNALREIDVYPDANLIMSLGEYLLMRGDLHEFLMANFLHDIGHSPLSHVLEPNPFIELDHEKITRNLILGKKIKSDDDIDYIDDIDWYITERYLLKMKAITEFEHRFFKNKEDPVYKIEDCIDKTKKCLFSWGKVPGVDDGKLKRYLKDDFAIDLVENAKIEKSSNNKIITISEDNEDNKYIAKMIIVSKTEAIMKIKDVRTDDLKVKAESGNLNIYEGKNSSFLKCLKINNEILDSEIVTVHDVLANFGLDKSRIVEILTGKILCRHCERTLISIEKIVSRYLFSWDSVPGDDNEKLIKFLKDDFNIDWVDDSKIHKFEDDRTIHISKDENTHEIMINEADEKATLKLSDGKTYDLNLKKEDGKRNIYKAWGTCSSCNEEINADEVGYERIYDTQFLNKLIHSEMDLDRIDHVKRDSEIPGLSLTSFRLTGLLGSISLVLPSSRAHDEVYVGRSSKSNAKIKSPYILVSPEGLSYLMDLLNSRRTIYNNIMFSDKNNWINGVANQITALAVRYLPHLTNMLPFITDQILAHFFTNELFLGTQIEKLNLLFQGKNDYSSYGEPMRYKLRDREVVTREDLKNMYVRIEEINNKERYDKMRVPAVVFYTNIKPTECPECGGELEDNGDGSYRCNVSGKPIKEAAVSEYQKEKDEKKRSWDDMLVYGKKFITTDGPKYLKFKELLIRGEKGKYNDTSREMFSDKPNELDVKNLFYVWIYDFVIKADTDDKNKSEEKCKNYIKKRIGGIWASNEGKEEFEKRFVDLDDAKEGSKLKHV